MLFPLKTFSLSHDDPVPVERTASVLRGRWTTQVVLTLLEGPRRFFQIMRDVEGVPRQALAHCLDDLERAGVVRRGLEGGEESRLEYGLTETGERLRFVLGAMYLWGLDVGRPSTASEHPRTSETDTAEGKGHDTD